MSEKSFLLQIIFTYLLGILFVYFTIDQILISGWGFLPIVFAMFGANDLVKGTKMLQLYIKIKRGNEPK